MRAHELTGRAVALQLLIALPVVMGGRLVLDVRAAPSMQRHVEVEHGAHCCKAHDHRLCILVHQAPWSVADPAPQPADPSPPTEISPSPALTAGPSGQIRLEPARGPPILA